MDHFQFFDVASIVWSVTQLHGANHSGNSGPLLKLHFKLLALA